MADFKKSWKFLSRWEGGFVDHPKDPGGATNFGISLRWYKSSVDPTADVDTIRGIKEEDAMELVKSRWWDGKLYYALHSQEVADRYFGFVFNMGSRNATRILQRAINAVETVSETVVVDGILGEKTVGAANAIFPPHLLEELRKQARAFYQRLIDRSPTLKVFEKRWFRRAGE